MIKDVAYLTETKLIEFLKERIDPDGYHNKGIPTIPVNFRPDFRSEKWKLIVEFDGYHHYTSSKVILEDTKRDSILGEYGYNVIRIPYFVQLTTPVIESLFSDMTDDTSDYIVYPQGFIDPKATLPADYCELGVKRFNTDLETTFLMIKHEIMESLRQKASGMDFYMVYPPSLMV